MRIFGPCRSPSTATHLPTCSATSRTICTRLACAAGSPWEKFTRTTSAPARIISPSTLGLSVAGPSVVRILVRRSIETSLIALFQNRDGRQLLAFQEFQEGATPGGDIGNIVFYTILLDRRQRIAAARD